MNDVVRLSIFVFAVGLGASARASDDELPLPPAGYLPSTTAPADAPLAPADTPVDAPVVDQPSIPLQPAAVAAAPAAATAAAPAHASASASAPSSENEALQADPFSAPLNDLAERFADLVACAKTRGGQVDVSTLHWYFGNTLNAWNKGLITAGDMPAGIDVNADLFEAAFLQRFSSRVPRADDALARKAGQALGDFLKAHIEKVRTSRGRSYGSASAFNNSNRTALMPSLSALATLAKNARNNSPRCASVRYDQDFWETPEYRGSIEAAYEQRQQRPQSGHEVASSPAASTETGSEAAAGHVSAPPTTGSEGAGRAPAAVTTTPDGTPVRIGRRVIRRNPDSLMNDDELSKTRGADQLGLCMAGEHGAGQRFMDSIQDSIAIGMKAQDPSLTKARIDEEYGFRARNGGHDVSLISQPLCTTTETSVRATLGRFPRTNRISRSGSLRMNAEEIALSNRFTNLYNGYRQRALAGDADAKSDLQDLWTRFFGCLAYSESLGDADANNARSSVISKVRAGMRGMGINDFHPLPGVKHYYDSWQSKPASRINIGLYQFSPVSTGNVRSCVMRWNELYGRKSVSIDGRSYSCKLPENDNRSLARILGSQAQSFNSFCGVQKVLQTFWVQSNTTKSTGTYPGNLRKEPEDRCVSFHMLAGKAYNHFGPFQNTTGKNLKKLFSCALP